MNSLIKYGSLLAVCFVVMASPTCEDEFYPVDPRRDHIYRLEAVSDVFTTETLSDDNLKAFEFKAVEKLMDYGDYVGIIYSQGYEASFREQARQSISGFFNSDQNAEAAISLNSISGPYSSYQILVDSAEIIEPFSREADTRYTGNMRYTEKILGINTQDTILLNHSYKTIGIILQMDYKDFGENSLLVWEVLLGKITTAD